MKISRKYFNPKTVSIALSVAILISLIVLGLRAWTAKDKYITVEIIASGDSWWLAQPKIPYWLADEIVPGGIEYSSDGKKLAEVLEVAKYDEDYSKILWAKVRIMVTEDKSNNGWRFQQKPLAIGYVLTVRPDHVNLSGLLVSINGKPESQYKTLNVTVKQYGMRPWQAEAITIGAIRKDGSGNTVAKIISKQIDPTEVTVNTSDGRILARKDPLRVDMTLNLEIMVIEKNGLNFFSRVQPVKIGKKLWIDFDLFEINDASIIKVNS